MSVTTITAKKTIGAIKPITIVTIASATVRLSTNTTTCATVITLTANIYKDVDVKQLVLHCITSYFFTFRDKSLSYIVYEIETAG